MLTKYIKKKLLRRLQYNLVQDRQKKNIWECDECNPADTHDTNVVDFNVADDS